MQEKKQPLNRKKTPPARMQTQGKASAGTHRVPQRRTVQTSVPVNRQPQLSNDERRRRRAERIRKKRRRRNIILAAVLTVLLLTVGIVLCLTVFFHITAVTVSGDEIYPPDEIVRSSEIQIGKNMFLLPTKKIAESIEQSLPYIEQAELHRSPSGEIKIQITAAKAVAAVERDGTFLLLNAKGKVLEENVAALNDGVFVLKTGEIQSAEAGQVISFTDENTLENFKTLLSVFEQAELRGITALDLTDNSNLKATYAGRILLQLGGIQALPDKMDFIKATLARSEEDEPDFKGEIDFTIPKKAFLRPEEAKTTVPHPANSNTDAASTTQESTTAAPQPAAETTAEPAA